MKEIYEHLVDDALRTDVPDYNVIARRLQDPELLQLLHCAIGLCTESGEFMDMLKKHIFYGKPLDRQNAIEELGDVTWYERIGVSALKIGYLEMIQRNVAKLRARYPDKFSEDRAINRDLGKESQALSGGGKE